MKKLQELETLNESLQGQTVGIKRAHEQLQKELKKLLKEKEKLQLKYNKQIKEVKTKQDEEKQILSNQINTLTNANDRLEKEISEVGVVVNKL